jgi:hypothetical protein
LLKQAFLNFITILKMYQSKAGLIMNTMFMLESKETGGIYLINQTNKPLNNMFDKREGYQNTISIPCPSRRSDTQALQIDTHAHSQAYKHA